VQLHCTGCKYDYANSLLLFCAAAAAALVHLLSRLKVSAKVYATWEQ
jgi:hypothetical protein